MQPGPSSPARGISGDAGPRAGEGANEHRQDNEAGTGFLYFRAQEEILQLVNLDTISVHFSLCNQPICSSLRIGRARPAAGRRLSGTLFIPVCRGHSRRAERENKALSEPLPAGLGQSGELQPPQSQRTAGPSPGKAAARGEGGLSKGLGAVQRDRCDTQISSAFSRLCLLIPSSALAQAGKGGLCFGCLASKPCSSHGRLSTGHAVPSWSGEGLGSQSCSVGTLVKLVGAAAGS